MPLGFATATLALTLDSGFRMNLADLRVSPDRVAQLPTNKSAEIKKPVQATVGNKAERVNEPVTSPSLTVAPPVKNVESTRKSIGEAKADTNAVLRPLTGQADAHATGAPAIEIPVNSSNVKLSQIACIGWLCVCACWFIQWMTSTWRVTRWLKNGHAHELLDDLMHKLSDRVPLRRQPRVVMLDVAQPFTVGWLRPTIVIPQRALKETFTGAVARAASA